MPVLRRSIAVTLHKQQQQQQQQQQTEEVTEGPSPSDQVFVIESTGEIYPTYEEYLERVTLYHQPVWTCRLTGHTGLTFYEAQVSEEGARKSLDEFPEWWKPYVLVMTHCSTEALDVLASRIVIWCRGHLALNEPVNLPFNEQWFQGVVSGTPPFREDETETEDYRGYRISINDGDLIMTGACQSPDDVRRQFSPPNKSFLKKYIRSVAVRYGHAGMPWLIRDDLVRKYDIRKKLSPELELRIKQLKTLRNERERAMRTRQLSPSSLELTPTSKNGATTPVIEEIRYPILDEFIPLDRQIDPSLWPTPKSLSRNLSTVKRFGDVLELWAFIHAFEGNLQVSPMGLAHFVSALEYRQPNNPIMEAIVGGFMNQFNRNIRTTKSREERVEEFLQADDENRMFIRPACLSDTNDSMTEEALEEFVREELRGSKKTWDLQVLEFLWEIRLIPEARSLLEIIAEESIGSVVSLLGIKKLELLLLLRNFYLTVVSLRSHVDREVEAGAELKQQMREMEGELRRLVKQQQEIVVQRDSLNSQLQDEDQPPLQVIKRLKKELREAESQMERLHKEEGKLDKKIEGLKHKQHRHGVVRMRMLGEDRQGRRYWWLDLHLSGRLAEGKSSFSGSSVLLVELEDNNWGYYDSEDEIDALLNYLNPLGSRESHLGASISEILDELLNSLAPFPHTEQLEIESSEPFELDRKERSEDEEMPIVDVRRRQRRGLSSINKRTKLADLPDFLRYRNNLASSTRNK